MISGVNIRWAVYLTAVVLLASWIGWSASRSWETIQNLGEATAWQLRPHPDADHFQQTLLKLQNLALTYEIRPDPAIWEQLAGSSPTLLAWIDRPALNIVSASENLILTKVRLECQKYQDCLRRLPETNQPGGGSLPPTGALDRLRPHFKELAKLGKLLDDAQIQSRNVFLADVHNRLVYLHAQFWSLLGLLFVLGSIAALWVYRGMIAPLQLQLVAGRRWVERHEKLASLGLLAAGIAHEIRNPLTAIKARLFTLKKGLKMDSGVRADAEVIDEEINRLEHIVKDFLQFARPAEPQFKMATAQEALREIGTLMGPQLEKQSIQLVVEDSAPVAVRIDPHQIKQVLMNLVQNAAESIEHHGTISLRSNRDFRQLAGKMTEVAILEVTDTGKGIAPEVQKRLFDPFFTTKATGNGLGLAIAAGIVEKHGGLLEYQTKPGWGTTFGIIIPIVQPAT